MQNENTATDGRLHDSGDIIYTAQGKFEVTGVSYQDGENGEHRNFTYLMRDAKEVQTERDVEAAHQEALANMAKAEAKKES